jgi:hypothetical protein
VIARSASVYPSWKRIIGLDVVMLSRLFFSPKEKAKNLWRYFHAKKINLVNEINSLKTLAHFGRGGTTSVVGEGLV